MKDKLRQIGENIRNIRIEKKLSQEQLAELSDYSVSQIYRIEAGSANISLEGLIRIMEALDINANTLIKVNMNSEKNEELYYELLSIISGRSEKEVKFLIITIKQLIDNVNSYIIE